MKTDRASLPRHIATLFVVVIYALGLAACAPTAVTDDNPPPTKILPIAPTVLAPIERISEFDPSPVPTITSINEVVIPSTQIPPALPLATPPPPPTLPEPIILEIFSPIDGSGVELGATRVIGRTSAPSLDINGMPVDLNQDGSFQRDVPLREGVNLLEVVASASTGRTKSEQIVVFVISPIAALPFSLLYPFDGLQVRTPIISVVGVTQPDAVVGVNGLPVEVNSLGIFSTTLTLQEGDNLIEIVATDIREVRFQTVAVFYLP